VSTDPIGWQLIVRWMRGGRVEGIAENFTEKKFSNYMTRHTLDILLIAYFLARSDL
jgi:hypothetical protein